MNKRALIRQLDRRMSDEWGLLEIWVTLDVPASILRWSPGPEWVEAACGYYWLRPSSDGRHEVMVLTYDRRLYTEDWVLSEPPLALVSTFITSECASWASFEDKPHRIYSTADSAGVELRIQSIEGDHPAALYNRQRQMVRESVSALLHTIQPPASYHTMWFGDEVQIKPDGSGWYLTLNPKLGLYEGEFAKDYWPDVHDLAYMVQHFVKVFQARKTYVERREQNHFVDSLWHNAMKAITKAEKGDDGPERPRKQQGSLH